MRETFCKLYDEINTRNLMDNTEKMLRAEQGQTFHDYHQAVACAKLLMQQAGSWLGGPAFPNALKPICRERNLAARRGVASTCGRTANPSRKNPASRRPTWHKD